MSKELLSGYYGLLNDEQIRELGKMGVIEPFEPELVSKTTMPWGEPQNVISYGVSSFGYDVRLSSDSFHLFQNSYFGFSEDGKTPSFVDPKNFTREHLQDLYDQPYIIIPPNGFVLARTVETFNIPDDVLVVFLGKSTYARVGISCNVTPAEPGWKGHLTLEISNDTPNHVKVYADEGIAQALFFKGLRPRTTYGERKGKYQNQVGVTFPKVGNN